MGHRGDWWDVLGGERQQRRTHHCQGRSSAPGSQVFRRQPGVRAPAGPLHRALALFLLLRYTSEICCLRRREHGGQGSVWAAGGGGEGGGWGGEGEGAKGGKSGLQLAVLLLQVGVLHLELAVRLHEDGICIEALLQASLRLRQLLLHRVGGCFLLVSSCLGGNPVLQLPPHHPLLWAEVVQVGSLPRWRLVFLILLLLDVQEEILLR